MKFELMVVLSGEIRVMCSFGIGLIGIGFMGKCYVLVYGLVKVVFGDVFVFCFEVLCDVLED